MAERQEQTRQAGGFTLVEMMVAVLIVGALAAAAITGSRSALGAARESQCMGNLRIIGVGLHLYAQENHGMLPETTHTAELGKAWIHALEDLIGDFDATRICPADPLRRERQAHGGSSYILNSYLFVPNVDFMGRPRGSALNRLSAIPQPERTLVAFVCSDQVGTHAGNDHTHSERWTNWQAVIRDISPDRHRSSRSNYLFVDGHVESWRSEVVKRRISQGDNIAAPPGIH